MTTIHIILSYAPEKSKLFFKLQFTFYILVSLKTLELSCRWNIWTENATDWWIAKKRAFCFGYQFDSNPTKCSRYNWFIMRIVAHKNSLHLVCFLKMSFKLTAWPNYRSLSLNKISTHFLFPDFLKKFSTLFHRLERYSFSNIQVYFSIFFPLKLFKWIAVIYVCFQLHLKGFP